MPLILDDLLAAFPPPPETLHLRDLMRRQAAPSDAETRATYREALAQLVDEGRLERKRGRRYGLPKVEIFVVGTLTVDRRGFGFVAPEDGSPSIFVDPYGLGEAIHRDRVRVLVRAGHKGPEGEVTEVLARGTHTFVGTVRQTGGGRWLIPRDARLSFRVQALDDESPTGARPPRDGELVAAAFVDWPDEARSWPTARIIKVFGRDGLAARETDLITYDLGLRIEFPPEVVAEAEAYGAVPPEEVERRHDLRDRPLVTIDPDDAKDFDDAVHAEPRPGGGWVMTVAVADVSWFVREGTALDDEALARGCSVYLPDRVLPMLPHRLSTELCSLRPGVDRLAMVAEFTVSPEGVRGPAAVYEAVIRSHARLSYDEVASILGLDRPRRPGRAAAEALRGELDALLAATRALRERRVARGRLDLDTAEPRVRLAPDGDIEAIDDAVRHEAHRLVEEAMVAANEAVAERFVEADHPALYRVHDTPSSEGLARLRRVAELVGAPPVPIIGDVRGLDRYVAALGDHPQRSLLQIMLLRSMARAAYRAEVSPHFGLGSDAYLHFTSPIRRYPDLVVHRLIRGALSGDASDAEPDTLAEVAARCSRLERLAIDAERAVMGLYKALLMRRHIGETAEGMVMGVTGSGLFVRLERWNTEGFVPVRALGGENFRVVSRDTTLLDMKSGARHRIGERIKVRVVDVSLRQRRVELEPESPRSARRSQGRSAGRVARRGAGRFGGRRFSRR